MTAPPAPRLDILLATYNGARHLPEQLASLEAQSVTDWRVLIRDDGSTDATGTLLRDWVQAQGVRAVLIEDGEAGLGACASFARLLSHSTAPYFMFCDQDDVWRPEKCARLLQEMQAMEARAGANVPLLAHCDLAVVDADLAPISDSFWHYRGCPPEALRRPHVLLVENVVTGCAMIGNAALRARGMPIPPRAMMHDWWLALIALHLGGIAHVPDALALYRRHTNNVTAGIHRPSVVASARDMVLNPAALLERTRRGVDGVKEQAAALAEHLVKADAGQDADTRLCRDLGDLDRAGIWRRKTFLVRHGLWTPSLVRNIGLMLAI